MSRFPIESSDDRLKDLYLSGWAYALMDSTGSYILGRCWSQPSAVRKSASCGRYFIDLSRKFRELSP